MPMAKVNTLNEFVAELQKYTVKHGDMPVAMYRDPEGNGVFTSQYVGMHDGDNVVSVIPDESTNIA